MAELNVGRHCQVERCRRLDFLPFVCDGCSGVFCLEHRSRESHSCPEVTVLNKRTKSDTHTSHPCSFRECAERELVPIMCPYCEKNFCLRHRHQSDHNCEKLEIPRPRMAASQKLVKDVIDSKTGETASKRRKGAKNSETAAKVALMKLKMHAAGDKSLPQRLSFLPVLGVLHYHQSDRLKRCITEVYSRLSRWKEFTFRFSYLRGAKRRGKPCSFAEDGVSERPQTSQLL
ncbi:AN1-type zinc finger protein 1 isoform X2 [Odocoileus virginianus]|uniref:AN1-type zinc finger protein 1 isoform X2 n=1 Tax=Odocoileus virginianus TaxID=9874 RepID=A0ABM4J0H7_ODOVR